MARLLENLWLWEFQWRLNAETEHAPTREEIIAQAERYDHIPMPGSDRQAEFNRHIATCLLAATEWLERSNEMTIDEARRVTQVAFVRTGSWLATSVMALWLHLDRRPFEALRKRGLARTSQRLWGNGMTFEDQHETDRVILCVKDCPFTEFFWNAGRSDLAETVCLWDGAWMEQVNRLKKGVNVQRPATIAGGCEICAFEFERAPRHSRCRTKANGSSKDHSHP